VYLCICVSGQRNHSLTTSAVTTGSGVPGSLLAGLLESCQILLALSR
jgi:hypothetical protein